MGIYPYSIAQLDHPHIWDLLNKNHENHINNMFMYIVSSDPGKDIKQINIITFI